jgi:DcmR-like sensory protein
MSLKPAAGRAHVLQSWRDDCHAVPDGKISMACTAYRQQETSAMATALRASGISVVGAMPWGTHGCLFYETTQDLLDTLVPYFKAGLEHREFCLWILSKPLTEEEARRALQQAVPDLDRHLAERSIEILPYDAWWT